MRIYVNLPLLRHSFIQRILWVGSTQQCLYAEQDCPYLQSGGPVVLEDVEADSSQAIDVWVIDACEEAYPGWAHGVVVWEEELELEHAASTNVNTWLIPGIH